MNALFTSRNAASLGKLMTAVNPRRVSVLRFALLGAILGSCVDSVAPKSLSAPTDVTVTVLDAHSVRVSWTRSAESDYVEVYTIYRDGNKVGESTGTTFDDTGLPDGVTYKYRVSASGYGLVSDMSIETAQSAIALPDVTPPTITSTTPANNSTGVSRSATINVTFNEAIDAATLTTSTVVVKAPGGSTIPGGVVYNSGTRTAIFTPTSAYPNVSSVLVTVTTGVKDVAGNRIATDFNFSFTTRDDVAPTVLSVTPANGATGIPVGTAIAVVFSEAMDASSINATNITLQNTSTTSAVVAQVSYNAAANTATITPSSALSFGSSYSLTVSTGVKDAAGNALASTFTSSFTTSGAPDTTPPTVTSVSPSSGAAAVPVNSAISVTFSESMDASTITGSTITLVNASTSANVAGAVSYTAATNTATFNPQAALAFSTTYNIVVTTAARDLSGNSLQSTFSSSFSTAAAPDLTPPNVTAITPANQSVGVSVNVAPTVTFSEAMNPATVSGSLSLVVTATSTPVVATVVYNAANNTATITPTTALAFSTSYTIVVGTAATDLAGNPLTAQVASVFTTSGAPDTTPPNVLSSSPAHLQSNVSVTTNVSVTFSEPMDPATINTSTIILSLTGTAVNVSGTVSYNAATNTATFTPSSNLPFSTSFTVTVTTGARDLAGNPLTSTFTSIFATGAPPDTIAPTVTSSNPANGATAVAVSIQPTVQFSEAMKATTVNSTTVRVTVTSSGVSVPGSVAYDAASNTATFIPTTQLSPSTQYTITVTTGAQDLAGNDLASTYTATFTTAIAPDTTKPTVVSYTRIGRTGPPLENRSITAVTFSEPMNPATLNTSTITLQSNRTGGFLPGTITYDANTNTAYFASNIPLNYVASGGPTYTLAVSTGATDVAGNPLASPYSVVEDRLSYFQGTSRQPGDDSQAQIHLHVTFFQNGNALSLPSDCLGLPPADCDALPENQAAVTALGDLDDTNGGSVGLAATIVDLVGSVNNNNITFTITLKNGRKFTFTGTLSGIDSMSGILTSDYLPPAGVPITLARN